MPQREEQTEPTQHALWEQTPWLAKDLSLEEPQRHSGPPLRLSDEHVVDVLLDGESIRRV